MTAKDMRDRVIRHFRRAKKPLSAEMLASLMRLKKSERPRLLLTLQQMERDGELTQSKKGRYTLADTAGSVRGRILSLNKSFGFARLEETGEDCFIAGRYLGDALPGDTVAIRIGAPDSRGTQGAVVKVLEPGPRLFAGRLTSERADRFAVEPDGGFRYPLPVRRSTVGGAVPGDKVRFAVKRNKQGDWTAGILTVYGAADSAKSSADAIIDSRGIPYVFPEEVFAQAEALRKAGLSAKELEGREDLRALPLFTIDGRDAKDLDDAVSLERTADGWVLGVHIADVSHYVQADTPLDVEARQRGTSVYFADRVIPMLPEALSNGACSLNAGEDKLALSALMILDAAGSCQSLRLVKSVIVSKVRGVYDEVNALFAGTADEAVRAKYALVWPQLQEMRHLAALLKRAAEKRGTMDLISVETRFILDEEGKPAALLPRQSGEAEGMIEQFMIAANVAVAALARRKKLPFIYRVHERPNPEKLALLMETTRALGLKTPLQSDDLPQMALRELMEEARDTPYARLVSEQLLRSMAKAQYSDNPLGHYGLALQDYCHFTSPIRRYPDLAIHRILSDHLAHTPKAALYDRYGAFVRAAAASSSECEVRAMTAERDCEACYKAEYMLGFLGQTFPGVIVSASDFGLYVELENTVTGLLRLEHLPEEELRFNGVASLTDPLGRPRYTVGQSIDIQVAACDVSMGRVSFTLPPSAD